jgi:hypothetical protein
MSNDPSPPPDPPPDPGGEAGATPEEREFLSALGQYKRASRRPRPTMGEVFRVVLSLGYRKVAEPGPLPAGSPPQGATGGPSKFRGRRRVITVGPLPTPDPPAQ